MLIIIKMDKHMTKGDMLNAMNMAMKKMKKDELQATYDAMMNQKQNLLMKSWNLTV